MTDPTGTVTHTYNSYSDVLTRSDQMGGVTTLTYDLKGNLLTLKDALNKTSMFTSDARGLITSTTDPLNHSSSFEYDTAGNLTKRTDAASHDTTIAYDARGRITSVTDALNRTSTAFFDSLGRIRISFDPLHRQLSQVYDQNNDLTKAGIVGGGFGTIQYDNNRDPLAQIDPLGDRQTFTYDTTLNRLTKWSDALGNPVFYDSDPNGNLTSYAYDLLDRRTSLTDPLSNVWTSLFTTLSDGTVRTLLTNPLSQQTQQVLRA